MYKILTIESNYRILEIPTNKIVGEFTSPWKATRLHRRLEDGSGFEGFTPDFISSKYLGINDKA